MPDVLIDLRRPASDGVDVGTVGAVECVPTSRREVDGAIVLPSPFAARLVDGAVTVDLAETGLDWCWRITERVRDGVTRYVTVPASEVTLDYADLVDVDPDTLDPWEPGLSAAYDAALALKLNAADLDTAAAVLDADPASTLRVQQDARLSSTYAPIAHEHTAADIDSEAATDGYVLTADGAGGSAWEAAPAGSGSVATDAIFDAKGDLAVGTGADAAAKLTVGTNGQVLTADSSTATGLKWAAASGGTLTGTGSPEGVVTATVGSTYIDTAATRGAIQWIKSSGTGNTGWSVSYGDTGKRLVTSLFSSTYLNLAVFSDWGAWIQRVGGAVTMTVLARWKSTQAAFVDITDASTIPSGFYPASTVVFKGYGADAAHDDTLLFVHIGTRKIRGIGVSGQDFQLTATWLTNEAWPSTLPGTAA